MKSWLVCVSLLIGLSSCGQCARRESPLQRFDALAPQLRALTRETQRLTLDVATLAHQMRAGDFSGVRASSARLRRESDSFSRRAGRLGNETRAFAGRSGQWMAKRYLTLVTTALSMEWWEGRSLVSLSEAAWADPFVVSLPDEARLRRLSGRSQWYAWRAVLSVRRAEWWRNRYRQTLRYTVVKRRAVETT